MRPMKGDPCDDYGLIKQWPMYGSPKIDGFRAFKYEGSLRTSSFRPFPNVHLQDWAKIIPRGYDGELVVGNPATPMAFNETSKIVTSHNKPIAGIRFYVFDNFSINGPYLERITTGVKAVFRLTQVRLDGPDAAFAYEVKMLEAGFEGIVLRRPDAPYKYGRSTLTDQGMLKVKRFTDAEGVIVDVEEMYHNKNAAKTDAQGYTDRSSKKEGMVPAGVVGTLVVNYKGQIIRVSQGLTDEMRVEFMKNPPIGKLSKFKFPPGGKDVSLGGTGIRPPYVFLGLRDWRDT